MDGTKRTAFASAVYFLNRRAYLLPEQFPIEQVIDFCVSIAEENLRQSGGEDIQVTEISEIAAWLQVLLTISD